MRLQFILYFAWALIEVVRGFALDYAKPPQCNYTSTLSPSTSPYAAINDKIFLCIFLTAGPKKIFSLAFAIPVDTYSSLQLTGAYQKLGKPTGPTEEEGFYMWTSTPRKVVGPIDTNTTVTTPRSIPLSKKTNPVAAWPQECGLAASDAVPLPAATSATGEYTTEVTSSCPFMFMTDTHALPILSLVVNMEQGNVTSLVWDNQCMTCSSNSPECLKGYQSMSLFDTIADVTLMPDVNSGLYLTGGCAALHDVCVASVTGVVDPNNANVCDPKILVTFSGTDRNDRQLTTAGIRLSQFAGLSISSLWDSVVYSFVPPSDESADTVVNAADEDGDPGTPV